MFRATENKLRVPVSLMSVTFNNFHDTALFLYLLEISCGFQGVLQKETSGNKWVKSIFRHRLCNELGITVSIISILFSLKCSS